MSAILLKNISSLYVRQGQEHSGVDLLVENNRVAAIGNSLVSPNARQINCNGKVVLPGLINTHHHFFQTMTRCLPGAQNSGLFDWLIFHYPIWKYLDEDIFRAAYDLAIVELLLTGCTTTSDHNYLFPSSIAADLMEAEIHSADKLGIRFCATRGSMSLGKSKGGLPPDEVIENDETILEHSEKCILEFHDREPFSMCQIHLAPCSPFNVSKQLLVDTAALARKYGVRLHTHLAETKDEDEFCRDRYGLSPLNLMEDVGWLKSDVWFAHGIHFSDGDLKKLSHHHCGISHCPSSNMRLGSGVARIPEMIKMGIPVGLAVDGSASNDSSNMLGELRQAMLLSRIGFGANAMSARQAIDLATSGSASVLGRKELGTLDVGQAADISIFDVDRIDFAGAADPIAGLLFCGNSQRAWVVIVNGKVVVEEGRLLTGDESHITRAAQTQSKRLWQKSGIL
jgi:cytosine/adenosine deaminase-related metal-dependent hydrolase